MQHQHEALQQACSPSQTQAAMQPTDANHRHKLCLKPHIILSTCSWTNSPCPAMTNKLAEVRVRKLESLFIILAAFLSSPSKPEPIGSVPSQPSMRSPCSPMALAFRAPWFDPPPFGEEGGRENPQRASTFPFNKTPLSEGPISFCFQGQRQALIL